MILGLYLGALLFGGILIGVSLLGGHDGDGDGHADSGPLHQIGDAAEQAGADGQSELAHAVQVAGHAAAKAGEAADKLASAEPLWMPFLSLRFWSFFGAAFGVTGLAIRLISGSDLISLLIALPFGAAIGYAVSTLFMRLRKDHVSGETDLGRYVGTEGKVVLPVRPGDIGKITIRGPAGVIEMRATTMDGVELKVGQPVLIAAVKDGFAEVTGLKQLPG